MNIRFSKYHGAGNDFIIIDNRSQIFQDYSGYKDTISFICDRRTGIGADGLILLNSHHENNFSMVYFNKDGIEGSMCGNGGRCIVAFANSLGLINETAFFSAVDGQHEAQIISVDNNTSEVRLKMSDVNTCNKDDDYYLINTGSPHYVCFVENLNHLDVNKIGSEIRNSSRFPGGVNVNFVKVKQNQLFVRTYERGVEAETLSCGTGVTASAIAAYIQGYTLSEKIIVDTKGGKLFVEFVSNNRSMFSNIWLTGPAAFVFKGEIVI